MVSLKVYDTLGRENRTLVESQQSAGNYAVTFDAASLPSGIYFYTLSAGSYSQIRKLTVVK